MSIAYEGVRGTYNSICSSKGFYSKYTCTETKGICVCVSKKVNYNKESFSLFLYLEKLLIL